MKIAVVDKDLKRIKLCRSVIAALDSCNICWIAQTGEETVKKAQFHRPDLMIIAVDLAGEVVQKVMREAPCPILLLTDDRQENLAAVYTAMRQGVLDVVTLSSEISQGELISKLRMLQMLVMSNREGKRKKAVKEPVYEGLLPPLVVIGASTGGPNAIATLLKGFPDDCPFATIIVQHVDPLFSKGLADWLQKESELNVDVIKAGSVPKIGEVLLASTNDHLVVTKEGQLHYTCYPLEKTYRPSIDVFFESLAANWQKTGVAVLLTGMGSDGAVGLKKLSDCGWHTIIEHEESCAVYGMPKAAVEVRASKNILPITEIGRSIMEALS